MKVEVEKLSQLERKLSVELPAEQVETSLRARYREIGKNARIKGFRPGKAPRALLKRYFGARVIEEVADALIEESVDHAFIEADEEPVGNVRLEKGVVQEGQSFHYAIRFDVLAVPDTVNTDGITVEPLDTQVTDEELDADIERRRQSCAELVPVEGRSADTGDTVAVDFSGSIDGELFPGGQGENMEFELGSGRMIQDFNDAIMGTIPGEEKTFDATFPDDYSAEHLAGKTASFTIKVLRLMAREVPDIDDDLAGDLGFESLADMRDKINAELSGRKEESAKEQQKADVSRQLTENNPFELPESHIEARTRDLIRGFASQFGIQDIDDPSFREAMGPQLETFRQQAEQLCREQALFKVLAEQQELTVTDEDLVARFEELAGDMGDEEREAARERYLSGPMRSRMSKTVLRDKVIAYLLEGSDSPSAATATSQNQQGEESPDKGESEAEDTVPAQDENESTDTGSEDAAETDDTKVQEESA